MSGRGGATDDLSSAVLTIVILFVILFIGIAALNPLAATVETGDTATDTVTRDAAVLPGDNSYVRLNDGGGADETVYETTGFAVNLTGASDSYVEAKSDFEIASDSNWTISTWAYVESGAGNDDMAVVSADGQATIAYNGSDSQWQGWYYDQGARNSYRVNVSTSGSEVGNFTNVMLWSNGTHLSIYRNNTQGEITSITSPSIATAPVGATNWDGRLEELRTFDRALDASERSQIVSSPVEEAPTFDPTARAMFDQPDRGSQLLLYTDTDLSQSNVSFSAGFPEEQLSSTVLIGDYNWRKDGPQLRAQPGGDLDGAPVAYATYAFNDIGAISTSLTDWIPLAGLIPIVILAVLIANVLRSSRR